MVKYYWQLLIIAISVSALFILSGCGDDTNDTEEEAVFPVNVTAVRSGSIDRSIQYMGTVSGEREVRIFSRIPDRIVELRADAGDVVSAGTVLAVIENRILRETVEQANAGLRVAQANFNNIEREYERSKRLFEENAISKQQFDQIETQYENVNSALRQAESALVQATENYNDSYIKAPFDGVISERFLDLGDMAVGGMPVFNIIQTNNVKVLISVVDREYNLIQEGQTVRLRARAHPDKYFTGEVTRKRPAFDPISRLAKVEILFPNKDGELYPGMFGEVELVIDSKDNVPLIPLTAVLYRIDVDESLGRLIDEQLVRQPYVYIVEDERAVSRTVEIGYETHDAAEIRKGLQPGEQIVVRGQSNLTDGVRVNIQNEGEYTFGGRDR